MNPYSAMLLSCDEVTTARGRVVVGGSFVYEVELQESYGGA